MSHQLSALTRISLTSTYSHSTNLRPKRPYIQAFVHAPIHPYVLSRFKALPLNPRLPTFLLGETAIVYVFFSLYKVAFSHPVISSFSSFQEAFTLGSEKFGRAPNPCVVPIRRVSISASAPAHTNSFSVRHVPIRKFPYYDHPLKSDHVSKPKPKPNRN